MSKVEPRDHTVRRRCTVYEHRKETSTWIGASIAGVIAVIAAGGLESAPPIFKHLALTLSVFAAGLLGLARAQFSWSLAILEYNIDYYGLDKCELDSLIEWSRLPREATVWPVHTEQLWLTSIRLIFLAGLTLIGGLWYQYLLLRPHSPSLLPFTPLPSPSNLLLRTCLFC